MRGKNPSKKKYCKLDKKRKTRKIYQNKVNNNYRKNLDFYETRAGKKVKEKTNAHMTYQTRLWFKECPLIHLEGLQKTILWIHVILFLLMHLQSCPLEILKKLVNVSAICLKNLVMF